MPYVKANLGCPALKKAARTGYRFAPGNLRRIAAFRRKG
jgi:hypothetical protein